MKRSEMASKIAHYLIHEGDPYDETEIKNAIIDADTILEIIEKAGMLPPFVDMDPRDYNGDDELDRWDVGGVVYPGKFMWESEDDSKAE